MAVSVVVARVAHVSVDSSTWTGRPYWAPPPSFWLKYALWRAFPWAWGMYSINMDAVCFCGLRSIRITGQEMLQHARY